MRAIVILALCAAGQILPDNAHAQRLDGARSAARPLWTDTVVPGPKPASRTRVFWARSLTATATSTVGALGGFVLGDMYTPVSRKDQWFSDEMAVGMLVGLLGGAALGAALHSYDSKCSFGTRFLRGLGGATVGLLPAAVIGPFGPGIGAAALQGPC